MVHAVAKQGTGADDHLIIAADESPTARYGKHVEGAGVHHNPTPGPAGSDWLYGHNWVILALLVQHPLWGVIAFPLFSMLNGGWAAYFCTDAEVSVRDILETIADSWVIEEFFHDTKEVWGSRSATSSQRVAEHWLLALEHADVYAGGDVFVGVVAGGVERP